MAKDLKAFIKAAKDKAAALPTGVDLQVAIQTCKTKLEGLEQQMKEFGEHVASAATDKDRERYEAVLAENFELRKKVVARLRELGETVDDPYVD